MSEPNARLQRVEQITATLTGDVSKLRVQLSAINRETTNIALSLAKDRAKPTISVWVRTATIAAVVSSAAAIAAVVVPAILQARQKATLQGQVTRLQSDVLLLTQTAAPQILERMGPVITGALKLADPEANRAITGAQHNLQLLVEAKATIGPSELQASKLALADLIGKRPDLPAAESFGKYLVNYSSTLQSGIAAQALPDCFADFGPQKIYSDPVRGLIVYVSFRHCKIDLSGSPGFARFIHQYDNVLPKLTEVNVTLTGGAVVLTSRPTSVTIHVSAANCLINLDGRDVERTYSRQLLRAALTSEPGALDFPLS